MCRSIASESRLVLRRSYSAKWSTLMQARSWPVGIVKLLHPCNSARRLSAADSVKVRIIRVPQGEIDGIQIDLFHLGLTYEMSATLATLLVCEGFAEPVIDFLDSHREQTAAYDHAADRRRRSS
jgi:hypothetical protein